MDTGGITCKETASGHSWNSRLYGYASILNAVDVILELVNYRVPNPLNNRNFTYSIDGHIEILLDSGPSARLYRVYADGSKQMHGGGSGVYIAETETEMFQTFRLL